MVEHSPLFGTGPSRSFPLSGRYDADHVGQARYRSSSSKQPCDECIALQHQTAGAFGTRAPVRWARQSVTGAVLLLCAPHKAEWVERDEQAAA